MSNKEFQARNGLIVGSNVFTVNVTTNAVSALGTINASAIQVNGTTIPSGATSNLIFNTANAAFAKANTGLQNTSFTLAGNLTIANTQTISVPIWYENETNITASYTVTAGRNAMTAGPVTLNTGVTITVPVGSTWTVV